MNVLKYLFVFNVLLFSNPIRCDYVIRKIAKSDAVEWKNVYQRIVGSVNHMALTPEEVTDEYVAHLIDAATSSGLGLVIELDGKLIGGMIKIRYDMKSSSHVLYGGSIGIHPDYRSQGLGTKLIQAFLQEVQNNYPDILRVELYTLETNRALALYQRLGFEIEGYLKHSKLMPDGSLQSYYMLSWFNPNFQFKS